MTSPQTTPKYIFKNGLRIVPPYYYSHKTTVKGRWIGKTILEVFTAEFRNYTEKQYLNRIQNNEFTIVRKIRGPNLTITGKDVLKYFLKSGDLILHAEHKHERPIIGEKPREFEIIYEDENIIVVNKPSGVLIHPVQNYFYNSLTEILKYEYSFEMIWPCHRLDKLTSGVSILAKKKEIASKLQVEIQNREVEKVYIARVNGKFDKTECFDDVIVLDTKKGKDNGVLKKEAKTFFEFIRYNSELDQSIVKCIPITGRTHQIRIHLRNLGHPIVNDPLYNGNGLMDLASVHDTQHMSDKNFEELETRAIRKRKDLENGEECSECGIKLYKNPNPKESILFLHALKYSQKDKNGWFFESKMPEWSNI